MSRICLSSLKRGTRFFEVSKTVEDPQEAQVEETYRDAEGNARRAFLDDCQYPLETHLIHTRSHCLHKDPKKH